jgi:VanZ family protein
MKALLKVRVIVIAIAVATSIFYLSLIKLPVYNALSIGHFDKWQHCTAYFILSLSWLVALHKKNKRYLILFCCILFGMLIEYLQKSITNYRTGDYLDVLANSVGVLLGFLAYTIISKKNRLKNKKTCN